MVFASTPKLKVGNDTMSKLRIWVINVFDVSKNTYRIWNDNAMIIFDKIDETEFTYKLYHKNEFIASFAKENHTIDNLDEYKHLLEEDNPMQDGQNIPHFVQRMVDIPKEIAELSQKIKKVEDTKIPKIVSSIEQAIELRDKNKKNEEKRDIIKKEISKLQDDLKKYKKTIIDRLPLHNTWIQINQYFIGCFYDDWGGGHTELEIKTNKNELGELKDRRH
jgi:hypothetical protein